MLQLIVIYYGPGLIGAAAQRAVAAGNATFLDTYLANWEPTSGFTLPQRVSLD